MTSASIHGSHQLRLAGWYGNPLAQRASAQWADMLDIQPDAERKVLALQPTHQQLATVRRYFDLPPFDM